MTLPPLLPEEILCPGCDVAVLVTDGVEVVMCAVEGLVCSTCHENCTSLVCARENDARDPHDVALDHHL